jgi:hypothetical protein
LRHGFSRERPAARHNLGELYAGVCGAGRKVKREEMQKGEERRDEERREMKGEDAWGRGPSEGRRGALGRMPQRCGQTHVPTRSRSTWILRVSGVFAVTTY